MSTVFIHISPLMGDKIRKTSEYKYSNGSVVTQNSNLLHINRYFRNSNTVYFLDFLFVTLLVTLYYDYSIK